MMCIENIIDNIARYLKLDSSVVRKRNFYQKNYNNITHYNMRIEDNIINELFKELMKTSNYKNRNKQIKKFNNNSKYLKKGISIL